ncbi:3'-5' exonuclease [Nocardioides convexus]|uniref:3'-5' exonuclease n=1 Tax=Nocardioides convexus TaxID=2712224 RepID=UPI0024186DE0|nr:3'-5' exonuclease [Nocardioides convexus]
MVRRRRVPGRLAAAVRAARPVARRARRACAWSVTRRRRSTPSPAPTRATCATSRSATPGRRRSSSSATTAPPRRWSPRPTRLLAGTTSAGVELRSQQASGSSVRYVGEPDEVAEARSVADRAARLHRAGTPYGEMAVLFRINAQSETFEDALTDRGIPYVVRGAARFFERREVREAVTRLRGAARSGEAEGLPWVGVVRDVLGGMGWTPEPPTTRGQARDRWESFQALVDQAEDFATERGIEASVAAFVEDLDRRANEQHAPTADGVTLATFHAAKGLEWDAVFCCGVQDGTVPISLRQPGGGAAGRGRGRAPAAVRRHDPCAPGA